MFQKLCYLFILFIIVIFCLRLFQSLKKKKENVLKKQNYEISYSKKSLMTANEISFYHKLIDIEKLGNYKVIPQVNLASIIHKDSLSKFRSELFRNVDYGIFNEKFEVLLLIELNDSTHNKKERKKRQPGTTNMS